VPARPDHPALERGMLERWRTQRTFERLKEANRGNTPFSLIDGPVTANNPLGVHHAWGRTLKDVYQRYHAMRGDDQHFQNGFDCQGLWVEVEVERALGLNSKREIERYGLDRFAEACRDRVVHFSRLQTEQSRRLGQWMDWPNSYYTMTDPNISAIWGFLAECHRRGWLYRGRRCMPWCPRCGTSLSQHELADSYQLVTHPSLVVALPLRDGDEALAVWTTTPWTLPANVAVAVHPDATYAAVRTNAQLVFVAEERLPHLPLTGPIERRVLGADLVGRRYRRPFDHLPAGAPIECRVVAWRDVSLAEGTGAVHIAPGCGEEDFRLGGLNGLAALSPLDEAGRFVDGYGDLTGLTTEQAREPILVTLREAHLLLVEGQIEHRYPNCWRCGTELVRRLVEEWFISSEEMREPMLQHASAVRWQPAHMGRRMEDWLRNMGDWCISRRRYWGLPLPFYLCPDGHLTVLAGKDELLARALPGSPVPRELHRPWIDDLLIACNDCGRPARRVPDVGDCWLDAGIVPFSTLGWRQPSATPGGLAGGAGTGLTGADLPDHAHWERWFPADLVCEMREQLRLWFYSMLFIGVVLADRAPYRAVLVHERVGDQDGRPMHKSRGNALDLDDTVETAGADLLRWACAGQDPGRDMRVGPAVAERIERELLTLWHTYSFFALYAGINDFQPDVETLRRGPEGCLRPLDRWLLARVQRLVARCREALDDLDTPTLVRECESFWDELSTWYVRLSRPRFWKSDDGADTRAAHRVLWYALAQLVRCVAPVMPFLADHVWENLVAGPCPDAPDSVHLAGYPEVLPELENPELLGQMRTVRLVVEAGRAARAEAGIRVRQPLRAVTVATEDPATVETWRHLLATELNVKQVRVTGGDPAVTFDTEITHELALEGEARDLIRRVQDLRRKAGLQVTDRIRLTYPDRHERCVDVHGAWIASETLATEIAPGDELSVERAT
jgi:isoleucyl-tRNA synthetase